MRRAAPRLLLPLLLLAVPLLAGSLRSAGRSVLSATDFDARAVQGPLAAERVHAQGGDPAQQEPILYANLFSPGFLYRTVSYAPVTVEMTDDAGYRAEGGGFAGEDGWAEVGFIEPDALLLPGRTLTLTRPGAEPLVVRLPDLAAAVDVDADRVFGRAPADETVQLEIDSGEGGAAIERMATADASGDWSLDLAGDTDLVAGAARGSVSLAAGQGVFVQVAFHDLVGDVTLGGDAVRGRATQGGMVEATITRMAGGEQTLGPAPVVGGGSFVLAGAQAPLAAGDRVRLRLLAQPVAAASERVVEGTLAPLTILLDPSADQLGGSAPVSTTVSVMADSLAGDAASFQAQSDDTGAWLVDAGAVDLGPGWRARASVAVAPGLRVGTLAVVEQLRLGVGIPLAVGRAMPGQPVTVTLRAADGTPKRVAEAVADDEGSYQIGFDNPFSPSPVAPQPGERVEIAFVAGDPVVLNVPALTAIADEAADAVGGQSDPGADIRVRVDGAPASSAGEVTAGPDGRYSAALTDFDLEAPATGVVEIDHPSGNVFFTTWAAVRLTSSIGNTFQSPFVTGTGAPMRRVHVALLDPDGSVVAEAEGPVFGGQIVFPGFSGSGSLFFLQPQDITGANVNMQTGDMLRVTVGDAVIERTVPPLDAVVLVQRDTIAGQTAPDATVTILVSQTPPSVDAQVEVTADASGNWTHTFGDELDLLFGDLIQLSADTEGHDWLQFMIAPGLLVDIDQSVMLGSLSPNVSAQVAVARDGSTLFQQLTESDADGALFVGFFDDDGDRIQLREGDSITVLPLSGSASSPLRLTIPKLDLTWDLDSDVVGGSASAGGSLILLATNAYARAGTLGISQAWPPIGADDAFRADFVPAPDVRPGTRLIAVYRPESGNYVVHQRTVPILNAEIAGPNVCGFGAPNEAVTGLLANDDEDRATFADVARFDGYLDASWADGDQAPLASRIADRATVRLVPEEDPVRMSLPPVTLAVDWQNGQVSGTGPPNTDLYLGAAQPCAQQQTPGILQINVSFPFTTRTDDDGNFQSGLPGAAFGSGLEVAVFDEADHRAFRQVIQPRVGIFLGENRVDGRAGPLVDVTLTLLGESSQERGRTAVVADVNGAFQGRLVDGASEPVLIAPGETIRLEVNGDSEDIPLENVDFDWSPGAAVIDGTAPAGRSFVLALRMDTGAMITINRQADQTGRFSFGENDVPPRAPWSMDDVVGVRMILPVEGGHQINRQTANFNGGAPVRDSRTVFLPWANNSAGSAAQTADRSPAPGWASVTEARALNADDAFGIGGHSARPEVLRWADVLGPLRSADGAGVPVDPSTENVLGARSNPLFVAPRHAITPTVLEPETDNATPWWFAPIVR